MSEIMDVSASHRAAAGAVLLADMHTPYSARRVSVARAKRLPVLSWSEQLANGLPEVDAEHRQLIGRVNALGDLHARGAAAEELCAAQTELRRYTVDHFRTEEELMRSHPVGAAKRDSHLAAHRSFVECLDRVEVLIAADPATVIEHLLGFMMNWLLHHITGFDAHMAREITALESGVPAGGGGVEDDAQNTTLIDTVSRLYESIGARSMDLLQANFRLRDEIERRQRAEETLQLAAIVFDTMDEAVTVTCADNRIVAVNPSFTRITGYSPDEAIGKYPRMLSDSVQPPEFFRKFWGSVEASGRWQGEVRSRRKSGELFVEWLTINRVRDASGKVTSHVSVFSDVTENRVEADRIHQLAHYDLLTGLPNRTLFVDRACQALAKARRDKTELAVMFLDLDLFKPINDTHGHAIGDLLLQEAAARMQNCLRASDTVARFGGDEFVVLLPVVEGAANTMAVAQKMRHALSQPFELAGHSLRISSSIGVAIHPAHGDDEEKLLRNADAAMYRAKSGGRDSVQFYHRDADEGVA